MSYRFQFTPDVAHTEVRLIVSPGQGIPFERWALEAPDALLRGVDLAQRLVASESAVAVDDALMINSSAIAGLTSSEAASLQLAPIAEAVAKLQAHGLFTQPSYRVDLFWARPTGQPIVGAQRVGPWLRIGDQVRRLPDALFTVAESVDALNASAGQGMEARLKSLAHLREALPGSAVAGLTETQGMIGNITIAIADAFSLEMKGEGTLQSLSPILYPARGQPEQPLLPPEQQRAFVHRFDSANTVNPVYSIGNQVFVVIEPPLRRALAEVRRVNGGSTATKRAFMANPRAFLRDALGDDADELVLEGLFRETSSYSDRVIGLGLWMPRVVPWIKLPPTDWFNSGSESNGGFGRREPADKAKLGIQVGDKRLELSKKDVEGHVDRTAPGSVAEVDLAIISSYFRC
jgi:hypothetical protein